MLIDCDTCTVRGEGCADCVVTVLLGAPPGWQEAGPTVVPLTPRARGASGGAAAGLDTPDAPGEEPSGCEVHHVDSGPAISRPVVELDEVERRAVRALADFGLVPPLRHQDASQPPVDRRVKGDRHVS